MKTPPKKVFIKENGEYIEIGYAEFCKIKELDESFAERRFIPIQGCLLEVDKITYKEIYKEDERNRYLRKLDLDNTVYQTNESEDNEGIMYCVNVVDYEFEERMINHIMLEKLLSALELLSADEQLLVDLIYYKGMSQRNAAETVGIAQSTLEYKIKTAISKLKMYIDNQ